MNDLQTHAIVTLSKGIPGAAVVASNLLKEYGERDIEALGELGITGSEVWLLFKDCCGQNLAETHRRLNEDEAISSLRKCPGSAFYEAASDA